MRKPILTFALLVASLAGSSAFAAEPAIKLITVSIERAYDGYWETKDNDRKLGEQRAKAQEQLDEARKRIEALQNEVKTKDEESKNSALSKEAQERAANEARAKFEELKQADAVARQFVENTQRQIQINQKNFHDIMFQRISEKVLEIGKARGATIILDTSGPTGFGISSILYADAGFDITDQVIIEMNKSKPADFKE